MRALIQKCREFTGNFVFCFQLLFKSNRKSMIFLLATNMVASVGPFINMYVMK